MTDRHILFISSWYPTRSAGLHGIFNRAFAQAASLRATVSVVHASADEGVKSGFEFGKYMDGNVLTVQVYYPRASGIPILGKLLQFRRRALACEAGLKVVLAERGKPSLVHLNVPIPAGPAAARLCRKLHIPLVVNECWTGYAPEDGMYRGVLLRSLTKRVLSRARFILPVSEYLRDLMLANGLSGQYRVVPNVVDVRIFSPLDTEKKTKFKRIVHVSALDDRQKNVSGILRAFVTAREKIPGLELVVIGNGPDAQALKQLSETLSPGGGITFSGAMDPPHVAAELNRADALVMFSNYETFCVAVPEALACGVPVITSDAPGIMSYFRTDFGYVVNRNNESALSRSIVDLYTGERTFDPEKMRAFVTERFSPEAVGAQLDEIYKAATTPL